jgi:protein-S-isoprenylcysteine O-methyltransferase Ste14
MPTPLRVLDFALIAWMITWLAAGVWRSRAVDRPAIAAQLPYQALVILGCLLLFGIGPARRLATLPLWQLAAWQAWSLCGLGIAGLLFTWWARVHIGRLWSSSVTCKADHHIVDSGPYGLVRHPIYTGVTVPGIAVAILTGTWPALAGAALLTLGWYVKARLEERFLRAQLGATAYDAYARRVPMMVPFWRW